MWVLSPLIPASSQRAAEEGSLPNHLQFLTSGVITIGRPAKKGGTTGKADILVFGESSVSNVHAALKVQPASAGGHGAVTITDLKSKFGTFVRHSQQGAAAAEDHRLDADQPVELHADDVIRFGTKCRYQLQQIQLNICFAGQYAADPDLLQAAAACNANTVSSCSDHSGSNRDRYCIAKDCDKLSPAALAALLLKVPLVTAAWLSAVAAKKSHAGSLPDPEAFSPERLMKPLLPGDNVRRFLTISNWQPPDADLLAGYTLLFPRGREGNLVAAAGCLGAEVLRKDAPLSQSQVEAEEQRAAANGRAAVVVQSTETVELPDPRCRPYITEQQLLRVIADESVAIIRSALEARKKALAAAAAVAAAAAAAAADEEAEETEEDEEESASAATASLEQLQPVVPTTRRAGRQAAAVSPAAKSPTKAQLALQQSTPGRTRGSKRGAGALAEAAPAAAAAAAAAVAAERLAAAGKSPAGRKRRKLEAAVQDGNGGGGGEFAPAAPTPTAGQGAAAAPTVPAAGSGHLPEQQRQQQQQQQQQADGAAGAAAELTQLKEGIFTAALVLPAAPQQVQQQPVLQNGSLNPGVNFKAFKRKQQPGGVQQGQVHDKPGAAAAGQVIALVPENKEPTGPDVDTFLREERQRQERMQKADELFHATLRAKPSQPRATQSKAAQPKAARGKAKK